MQQNIFKHLSYVVLFVIILQLFFSISYARKTGRVQYSGNPITNGGQTCSLCHNGGQEPNFSINGKSKITKDNEATLEINLSNSKGSVIGLNISTSSGSLVPLSDLYRLELDEITHNSPILVDTENFTIPFSLDLSKAKSEVDIYVSLVQANGDDSFGGDGVSSQVFNLFVDGGEKVEEPIGESFVQEVISSQIPLKFITGQVTDIYVSDFKKIFAVGKHGRIEVIDTEDQHPNTLFLNLRPHPEFEHNLPESGLLGFELDRNFQTNRYIYVYYSTKQGTSRVSRFTSKQDLTTIELSTEVIILEFQRPNPAESKKNRHYGGDLEFGSDGYLYISSGDGGRDDFGQDTTKLLGKILRIDVSESSSNKSQQCGIVSNYSLPTDNPFLDETNCGEIWAYGLRNPWRFTLDPQSQSMFIGDVGHQSWEELNIVENSGRGVNLGWNCYEGNTITDYTDANIDYSLASDQCNAISHVAPTLTFDHDQGFCSIIGGGIYQKGNYENLPENAYVFGDFCKQSIYVIDRNENESLNQPKLYEFSHVIADSKEQDNLRTYSFGIDKADGTIYTGGLGVINKIESFSATPKTVGIASGSGIFYQGIEISQNNQENNLVATSVSSDDIRSRILNPQIFTTKVKEVPLKRVQGAVTGIKVIDENQILVTGKHGFIELVDPEDSLSSKVVLNMRRHPLFDRSTPESGLLGIELDPNFITNKYIYIYYSTSLGTSRVSRFSYPNFDTAIDLQSEFVILEFERPYGGEGNKNRHFGGDIKFGSDGFLYVASGDGGKQDSARNQNFLLGKILRIDVHSVSKDKLGYCGIVNNYTIPDGNPYVTQSIVEDACGEIWISGLRNPWRFTFDKVQRSIIIGDVGFESWEEINTADGFGYASDFGWGCFEGKDVTEYALTVINKEDCIKDYKHPRILLDHSQGYCSVIGGVVTNGTRYLNMGSRYVYADVCKQTIFTVDTKELSSLSHTQPNIESFTFDTNLSEIPKVYTFGINEKDGTVYFGGSKTIYRIDEFILSDMR